MNKIYLSHFSAFQYYRNLRLQSHIVNHKFSKSIMQDYNISNHEILKETSQFCSTKKVDVMFQSKNQCYKTNRVRRHYYRKTLPAKSFWKITDKVNVVSPELLFCQMANYLSDIELMLFGLEICGSFTINNSEKGFCSNLSPLTNALKIRNYVKNLKFENPTFKSINQACKISSLLQDNSASPQESRLFISFCAPRSLGGYGLKNVVMNKEIELSKNASIICDQDSLRPDLCIFENKIAVEYDSDAFHDNARQNNKDKKRIDAYLHDGWKLVCIVPDQIYNLNSFHNIAIHILEANKQSSRFRAKNFEFKRRKMHTVLYQT